MALSASPNGTTNSAATYEVIQTSTLSSAGNSFLFSSIPQTYTDLVLKGHVRGTSSVTTLELLYQVNGQTGNYYDGLYIRGNGTTITSARSTKFINPTYAGPVGTMLGNSADSGFFSNHTLSWVDYSNTTTYKTLLAENSANAGGTAGAGVGTNDIITNMYFATLAITSILLFPETGQFSAGSTFTLYGLKGA